MRTISSRRLGHSTFGRVDPGVVDSAAGTLLTTYDRRHWIQKGKKSLYRATSSCTAPSGANAAAETTPKPPPPPRALYPQGNTRMRKPPDPQRYILARLPLSSLPVFPLPRTATNNSAAMLDYCSACLQRAPEDTVFARCSRCPVRYCSAKCRREIYLSHRMLCETDDNSYLEGISKWIEVR